MTSAPGIRQRVSPQQLLGAINRTWLEEARELLESARRPEAGIHDRWNALKYLSDYVSHRFELERGMVESMGHLIEPGHAAQLWVIAELMAALRWQVERAVGLCYRTDAFVAITQKFEQAFFHWCRAVEAAVGGLSWGKLPEETRGRFMLLGSKED